MGRCRNMNWTGFSLTAPRSQGKTKLRRRGLERTRWTITDFVNQPLASPLPELWVQRMLSAQRRLRSVGQRKQAPIEWVAQIAQLLEAAGWPGKLPAGSAEFQIVSRWWEAVDMCGSLGFDGGQMSWKEFLSELRNVLDKMLFAPESRHAPIV